MNEDPIKLQLKCKYEVNDSDRDVVVKAPFRRSQTPRHPNTSIFAKHPFLVTTPGSPSVPNGPSSNVNGGIGHNLQRIQVPASPFDPSQNTLRF
ncbi:hypothetical protein A2U01_0005665 [Trifolium medium]|uniref:Uncharacterized protein n=1 Tax=Trifolium medium TaxID=97028 RepID=A0A392MDI1_9FABA|nr:hypothetical protein [Trifolium medium]